jgi:large subunit ribosomal protein L23
MSTPSEIISSIHLSEKASILTENENKYVFKVVPWANKIEIKKAIETLFGKKVVAVNTCNYAGKLKRQRTAQAGRKNHWKKAVVQLAKGETIDIA